MLSKVVYFGTDRNEELVTYSRFGCVLHGLGEFANNRLKNLHISVRPTSFDAFV